MRQNYSDIVGELLALPTAPFAEHAIQEYIREFCHKKKAVTVSGDSVCPRLSSASLSFTERLEIAVEVA